MRRDLYSSLVVLALLVAGCRGGFPPEEVPDDPIAFMRQEAAMGISGIDEFRAALRIPNEDEPKTLKPRRATTLSLLHVPTGKVTPVPGVAAGTFPLDWSPDGFKLLMGRYDRATATFRLSTWNRLTGAYAPVRPDESAGGASLGGGPIRLAQIGRTRVPDGGYELGVRLVIDHQGLTTLPGGAPARDPDISPNGRMVVFERPVGGLRRDGPIMLARLGESRPSTIGRGSVPRFSRDGKWITFLRYRDGQTDVWLMRSNGAGKRALTHPTFAEEYPAVSPNGRYVLFASVRPPNTESQLYLVRVEDLREIQLTQSGQNGRPRW